MLRILIKSIQLSIVANRAQPQQCSRCGSDHQERQKFPILLQTKQEFRQQKNIEIYRLPGSSPKSPQQQGQLFPTKNEGQDLFVSKFSFTDLENNNSTGKFFTKKNL